MRRNDRLTIGEAARLARVSPSCLRHWERMGLLKAARTGGNYRVYVSDTIKQLKRIKYLRSSKRINLAGILHMQQTEEASRPVATPAEDIIPKVGERLAWLRQQHQFTLSQVAAKTGLSTSFLSALERGRAKASVATLQKLARLYGTNVLSFIGECVFARRLVRSAERQVFEPEVGVRMELLAFGNVQMEPHVFRVAPGATSGGAYQHSGEEFIYMLQGKFEIWLDDIERYVLEPGDSLYFQSTQAHRWRSLGNQEAILLWINTPPTF